MKRTIGILIILLAFVLASPAGLLADDIDIYGGIEISVKPNVLIIFDTSGSMGTEDVYGEPYDPAFDYSSYGTYTKDAVYAASWYWLTGSVDNVLCDSARQELKAKGYTTWRLKSNLNCRYDTSRERYRMGNYLNYLKSPMGTLRSRTEVAKEVILELIDSVDNVNLGLMRFNYEHGGRIEKPIGTGKTEMKAAVSALPASGWTPLAETLAEAGLYFAGKKSWFNDVDGNAKNFTENGIQYTSPMEYSCQKNYVILMTDGYSTKDKSEPLWKRDDKYKYINDDWIGGDYDTDTTDCDEWHPDGKCKSPAEDGDDGTDFLDDVAKYLYDNDINSSLGTVGTDFEKQNLTIFTIGFKTDFNLLVDTATNGGGQYFTAEKAADLKEAFESIISWIFEDSAVFVAPVVPVNRMNRTFAGDRLFLGFFRPKSGGLWSGNLKKYKLTSTGEMLDQNLNAATDSWGRILTTSHSFWSTTVDGPDVEKGGAGEQLLIRPVSSPRTIYTIAGIKAKALNHPDNGFTTTNPQITPTLLDVSTQAEKDAVINRTRGVDRGWMLGDIIHSEPTVIHYWTTDSDKVANGGDNDGFPDDNEIESYVFVGANDGMLHNFRDSDGFEQWAFIPPDLLPTLKLLMDSDTDHDYYVDGPPVTYERWDDNDSDGKIDPNEVKNILFFGERRGGDYYYALDVSNPTIPSYMYIVTPYHLRAAADKDGVDDPLHTDADLGQSWVKPEKHTIFVENDPTTDSDDDIVDVLLMGGGYDENQDFEPPAATDSVGRAVFSIQVEDTDGNSNADVKYLNYNGANYSDMTHSIIDISGFDRDANGYLDTVYAGDLGGHLFAFRDIEPGENPLNFNRPYAYDGVWEKRKLFELPTSPVTLGGQSVTLGLKFMYAADVVTEYFTDTSVSGGFTFGDFLFIGTGDRAHPASTDFTDALYAIKNLWTPLDTPFTTLTIDDLYDATANLVQVGTAEEQEAAFTALNDENNKGWFILMENDGEKVVSSPRVFAGVVYFTTYEPPSGTVSGDPCAVPTERGTARVYALDYKTGGAAIDFTEDGNLTTADRSLIVGTSIPSAPVITVMEDGVKIFVGVQGGVKSLTPTLEKSVKMYYWRQVF